MGDKKINSRRKGAKAENEVAHLLQAQGYDGAYRPNQFCGRNGDADVEGVEGVHIEVKRRETIRDEVFLQQSEKEAREGEIPIVMYRRNNEKWKVLLREDIAIAIFKELTPKQLKNIKKYVQNVKNVQ